MKAFIKKKRGSLQLSINAIVILILAITMLGLGLSFIKGIFGGTVEKLKGIEKQLAEEERKTLQDSIDEITFLQSRIDVTGRSQSMMFAIRNNRGEEHEFLVNDVDPVDSSKRTIQCFDALGSAAADAIRANPEIISFETYKTRSLDGQKSDVLPMEIKVTAGTPASIYSCEMKIYIDGTTEYAKKRFEILYKKG